MGLLTDMRTRLDDFGTLGLPFVLAITLSSYLIFRAFYNIYLHPLSGYPGPRLAAATRLWYCYYCTRGVLHDELHKTHEKYGDVIRIAPDELSYIDPQAWNDIYGHRVGKRELMKDPLFYTSLTASRGGIINCDRDRHSVLRKQASHGFSERSLKTQEHVIQKYADQMIERLEECAASGRATVNMVDWYNFFTFDVMGALVFGQSFECLTNWGYHPWVKLIFDSSKAGTLARCVKYWSFMAPIAPWLIPQHIHRRRVEQSKMAAEKAEFRKNIKDGRQDLISGYLAPDSGVTDVEYRSTVQTFITAGSETTATLMSGVTYYLLKNPKCMSRLTNEIRTAFSSAEEIDFVSVNKLPYLLACLDEGLRIYSPVADTFPRNTGEEEEMICGKMVPPHTTVGVHHWSTYHSTRHFERPDEFIPERWLEGNVGYENDRRDAVNAFTVGPRNCIGRNLAYVEMRNLMCRVLWRFDLKLDPRSDNWNRHRAFLLWEKPPMYVKLIPRDVKTA